MLIVLVAITLLVVSVGVIYYLLKSMGQDGVEIAAPTSCKSGQCGVRKVAGSEGECRQDDMRYEYAEAGEVSAEASPDRADALAEQSGSRPG